MFALWGDKAEALLGDEVRDALRAAGATRLQVNVDDAPVAGALRLTTSEEPITAIVSVWTDEDPGGVIDVLVDRCSRLAGWQVDERRPIEPPEIGDGCRADALANIALIRRPADLTHDEWLRRWLVDHTPIAIATQATFGYVQNVVERPVTDGAPPVAALVEELFPSEAVDDIHAFYGSGGDDAELNDRLTRLMDSVARMGADRDLDLVPSGRYSFDLL